jgi:hypothetical protein
MDVNETGKVDGLGRPVVDNSPAYKRWYNATVDRVTRGYDEQKARQEANTRRLSTLMLLIIVGLIAAGGLYGTMRENGYWGGDGGLNHGQGYPAGGYGIPGDPGGMNP